LKIDRATATMSATRHQTTTISQQQHEQGETEGRVRVRVRVADKEVGWRSEASHALFVEYRDHPRCERVICNLRNLQKLVAVY